MPNFRISEAAALLGVSDDTVRRWISAGRLAVESEGPVQRIDGEALAAFAHDQVDVHPGPTSARNRLPGIVTRVQVDGVMAQVDVAAGRYRLVSLMSREAAEDLGLAPGVLATAVVKATMVTVEADREHE